MRLQSQQKIELRGKKIIGGKIPLICLPIVAGDKAGLLSQAEVLRNLSPDLLEWRLDAFHHPDDVAQCIQALADLRSTIGSIPLILTCRIESEGGVQKVSPENRLNLFRSCMQTGMVDLVDIELRNDSSFIRDAFKKADQHDTKIILSFHDFEKTPEEEIIINRLVRAQEMGGHIAKAAVMPKSHNDTLVLLNATLKARTENMQIPMITMSMGELGIMTRIVGGLFGSDITFAKGVDASSPGQIPIERLRRAIPALYSPD